MGNKRIWRKILGYSVGQEVRLKNLSNWKSAVLPSRKGIIIQIDWDTSHTFILYWVKFGGTHTLQLIKGEFE